MVKVITILRGLLALGALYAAVYLGSIKKAEIPPNLLKDLAQKYYGNSLDLPLEGKVVIITGSTSGVGKGAAKELHKLGATVIIASRSQLKCDSTAVEIRNLGPVGIPVIAKSLDVSDLEDVTRFASWFKSQYSQLNILINNAGVSLKDERSTKDRPLQSKQGYDLMFATNYLGHFLLTELLLPELLSTPRARVVQVSSTANYLSDGADLYPGVGSGEESRPIAARVAIEDERHRKRSYANSKLAQVLHSLALQDRIASTSHSDLKIISTSPGLTNTGMIPTNTGWGLLREAFYSIEAGALSTLFGALSPELSGGEFLENVPHFMATSEGFEFAKKYQKMSNFQKDILFFVGFPGKVIQQHKEFGNMTVQSPNPVATDSKVLRNALYEWSRSEVNDYIVTQQDGTKGEIM